MKNRGRIASLFLAILGLGLVVFVVFSHIRPLLPGVFDWIGRICLVFILLSAALLARRSERFQRYWPVLYAYFIAVVATSVDLYLPSINWLLHAMNISIQTPTGIALDKLDSSLIIIVSIIILTKLSGASLGSIYLKKGNLKEGLKTGCIAFLAAAACSIFVAKLFGAQDLRLARIGPWIPWITIFILGNACNEELLFRGLFLNKINPLLGKMAANLVLVLPFVLHHTGVTYTNDALMFLAYLVPLAFVWGLITQKTDSIWGSVLFHAGTDIPVILVIFSRLSV